MKKLSENQMQQAINERKSERTSHKKKRMNIISIILIVLFTGVLIFSGYQIYLILADRFTANSEYDKLHETIDVDSIIPEKNEVVDEDGNIRIEYDLNGMQNLDFDYIAQVNDDVVGWIVNPGTVINYPVAQSDNNNTYLYTTFEGKRNNHGCIFMDCNNDPALTDYNTIIYGHHMKSGTMFASLCEYREQDYYEEHPYLFFYTPQGIYKLEVFSSYIDEATGIFTTINFKSDSDIDHFLNKIKGRSLIQSDVEVTAEDQIISLQTCTYEFEDAVFIVHCKLVPVE